ncbi:hypothetical protein BDK51DRAFT_32545 [Blyttiomyces helicus]|uniref:Uncharacterized protein n=1 Tax=Blyttiomyces helicus TaxID=388810 RepID=A0A4P9WJU5_9FUNG|nr:hypothetical protein BDK51DRAFT_32545 [Blyttiomyces helicus]|eukprot:RKO91808.1 hypothetical protein BDK51DRAFT_32545 [Blyttiomyces helicus]
MWATAFKFVLTVLPAECFNQANAAALTGATVASPRGSLPLPLLAPRLPKNINPREKSCLCKIGKRITATITKYETLLANSISLPSKHLTADRFEYATRPPPACALVFCEKTPKVPTYGCTLLAADLRSTIGDLMSSDRPTKNSFSAIIFAGSGQILAYSISKITNYTSKYGNIFKRGWRQRRAFTNTDPSFPIPYITRLHFPQPPLETAPLASLMDVGEYLLGKYGSYTKFRQPPSQRLLVASKGRYYETESVKLDSMDSLLLIVGVPYSEVLGRPRTFLLGIYWFFGYLGVILGGGQDAIL